MGRIDVYKRQVYSHVWVSADRVYDMFPFDGGYYATVKADDIGTLSEKLDIYTSDDPVSDTWDDDSADDVTDEMCIRDRSEAALAGNRALIGSETTLLSLQNGMGNLETVSYTHLM